MPISLLEAKDVTFFLAVKPYLSTKAQRLLDLLILLANPGLPFQGDLLNPVPILTLLDLAHNMTSSPPPQLLGPQLPQVVEEVEVEAGEETEAEESARQRGESHEPDTP